MPPIRLTMPSRIWPVGVSMGGASSCMRSKAPGALGPAANAGNVGGGGRCDARGCCAPVRTLSSLDADDRVPVSRMLIGVRDPHEERIVEEAPDELHAD